MHVFVKKEGRVHFDELDSIVEKGDELSIKNGMDQRLTLGFRLVEEAWALKGELAAFSGSDYFLRGFEYILREILILSHG